MERKLKRQNQIDKAAYDYHYNTDSIGQAGIADFIAGAKWADENQQSPWIKTDDLLPKIINNGGYSDIVLVIDENNNIELAIYSFYRDAWIRAYGNDDIDDSIIQNDITHWMKIPKLLNNNG